MEIFSFEFKFVSIQFVCEASECHPLYFVSCATIDTTETNGIHGVSSSVVMWLVKINVRDIKKRWKRGATQTKTHIKYSRTALMMKIEMFKHDSRADIQI